MLLFVYQVRYYLILQSTWYLVLITVLDLQHGYDYIIYCIPDIINTSRCKALVEDCFRARNYLR